MSWRGSPPVLSAAPLVCGELVEQSSGFAGSQALEWVLGDAERLPFPNDSMDSYTIAFGIRNVTRISRALQEAHRVRPPLLALGSHCSRAAKC